MTKARTGFLIALAIAGVTAVGCGSGSGTGSGIASAGVEVKVSMNQMAYSPKELTVKKGTTVIWVNDDVAGHAVVHDASPALFRTQGDLMKGETIQYTFAKAGTYLVYCSTPGHKEAGMKMTVVVTD